MSKKATTPEPEYRTITDKPICPECGFDFTGGSALSVRAHVEGHHPGFNRATIDSDAAQERADRLEQIAQELG